MTSDGSSARASAVRPSLEEQAHLAEGLARLHEGHDRLAAVDRAVGDGDAVRERTTNSSVGSAPSVKRTSPRRNDRESAAAAIGGELVVGELAEQLDAREQLVSGHHVRNLLQTAPVDQVRRQRRSPPLPLSGPVCPC